MATITATASGGTRAWSDTATWDTATVPTAADDVVLNATSGAVTIAAAAVARSLNCTGYTGTLTHNAAVTLTLGDATAAAGNAALTLAAGMTYTLGSSTTSAITLVSTSTTQQTVTIAGRTVGNLTFSGTNGTWILADALTTSGVLTVTAGTFNSGNQAITCLQVTLNGSGVSAAFGSSTITMTGTTAASYLFLRTGGASFTAGAATLNITGATSNSRNFTPGSTAFSQATLNYTVAGSPGTLVFSGVLDLAALNVSDASGPKTLHFTSGSTYTLRSVNIQGTPGALITIRSTTGGSAATLSKPSRVVSADYLSVQDITVTGGASWYAGANSTNVSGNTGWLWTAPSNWQFLQFA